MSQEMNTPKPTKPNDEELREQRSSIHMAMLAKSDNAKNCDHSTVILVGYAVTVAQRIALEARIEELNNLDTRRRYGMDYQASLDEIDEAKDARLAELTQQLEEAKSE